MRKNRIVSAILALLMTLSCVAALVLPTAAYDEIYLQNSYHKLTVDKKLTVAYFGGSVTVGSGLDSADQNTLSWRGLTRDWLKAKFPDAEIEEVYAAIGGTGSRFASYRATRDLKLDSKTIDLIFIENCINDNYEGLGGETEELKTNDAVNVAKVLANNPYADIIFLGTTDSGKTDGADYKALVAHREFAEENGFSFLNIGKNLWTKLNEMYKDNGGASAHWNEYFKDIVHPLAPGYRIYADDIIATYFQPMLDSNLDKNAYVPTAEKLNLTDRVKNADTNRFVTKSIGAITNVNKYAGSRGFNVGSQLVGSKDGAALAFKFTGTNAYLWSDKKAANGKYEAFIDGSDTPNVINLYRTSEGGQQFLFPVSPTPLENGEHTVVIVLRANVGGSQNYISNIAIDGADINSVEFVEVPEGYGFEIPLEPVVVDPDGLKLKIDNSKAIDINTGTYDDKKV
ncbi:MAG: SGNH/GDSL hydrolase family protein, partial [Clostridia bacterium]|nr:SGNH/GDSL hydrolase family protein [Clostridia bacterium]